MYAYLSNDENKWTVHENEQNKGANDIFPSSKRITKEKDTAFPSSVIHRI